MSLIVKDMLLVSLVALASVAVIYMQYFASLPLAQYAVWSWVVLLLAGILFLMFSKTGKELVSYIKAAKSEMRKVVWPKRQDVMWTTVVVGIAVVVFSILVSMLDSLLVWVLSGLIG